jgi:glycolate oxidase FAD binding subunit
VNAVTVSARLTDLASIVGEKYVAESPALLSSLAIDGVAPGVAVTPGSVEEVAAVLSYAYERGLVVVPAGGFAHQEIGRTPEKVDIVLRTERLNGIEHYDPGDLTIGIGAGATIAEIESMVRDQGQLFPLDIPHADRVTLGGAMAVAAHGPLKHFYGGLREYCLGARFVTAEGKAAKAGARVVKNVAGFDLMKLLIGSYGTLAVITSASFKLFPAPQATRTFLCHFTTLKEAIAFRDFIVASPLSPMCLEIFSPSAYDENSWTVAVRAGGSDRVLDRYAKELGSGVSKALAQYDEQGFWSHEQQLGNDAPVCLNVSVPPSFAGDLLEVAERAANQHQLSYAAWGRVATGSLLFAFGSGMAEDYTAVISAIRNALPRDGSAFITRCPVSLKKDIDVWGTSPTHLGSMQVLKQSLNPKDTLNRGRFLL